MKLFLIFLLFCSAVNSKEVLRYVQVLYRHGDRAPTVIFSENNNSNAWPYGLGQLTDIGIKQQYALGKWLRMRYKNFLKEKYDQKEIYIRSTDLDRAIMSAQSNLAGLYYEKGNILPNINWRPIPIHTMPERSDPFMIPFNCKLFNKQLDEMYKSDHYKSLFKGYEKTLETMRKATKNNEMQYEDTFHIFDSLFCENAHNITPPSWVTKEIYSNISKIYSINWKMMYGGKELAKLSGGRFFDEIVMKMENYVEKGFPKSEKMRVYSGHDINIASLLSSMGVYDGIHPPYASCVMIELLQNENKNFKSLKNWIVKIHYKTTTNITTELRIKECKSNPCNLEDFVDYSKTRILSVNNFNKMCLSSNSGNNIGIGISFYGLLLSVLYTIM